MRRLVDYVRATTRKQAEQDAYERANMACIEKGSYAEGLVYSIACQDCAAAIRALAKETP